MQGNSGPCAGQAILHTCQPSPPTAAAAVGGSVQTSTAGAAATTAIAGLAGLGCGDIAIAAQGRPLCPSSLFPPPLCQLAAAAAAFSFLFFLQGRKGLKTFSGIV